MKLVWFPTWRCQNYDAGKSHSHRCPYCPYGWDNKKDMLLYENEPHSFGKEEEWLTVAKFLLRNDQLLNNFVEVSGGEPLLYPRLHDVLVYTNFKWAITSNTINLPMIKKLDFSHALERCTSWSASYHPMSDRDGEFIEAVTYLAVRGVVPKVTVVVSKHTIGVIERAVNLLSSLPIRGVVWHLDAHDELSEDDIDYVSKFIGYRPFEAGTPRRGAMCNKHGELLGLGPDGSLYPCVTYTYTGQNKIRNIAVDYKIDLESKIETCVDECFAVCDWVKHREIM